MSSNIDSSTQFIRGRWFPLIELACVAFATILWEIGSLSPYIPFLIALAPWVVRFALGVSPFKGWGIDLALALFIVTAGITAWLAYDQPTAIYKFWLLVAAVLLFYAVANQPENNLWILAGLISALGIGFALYYLMKNDWGIYLSRIEIVNQLGLKWMAIRPTIKGKMIQPNIIAGIIAISLPFLLALGLRGCREKRWSGVIGIGLAVILLLIVLLMTALRGAWIAISATALIGALWWASACLARSLHWNRWLVFALILSLSMVIGVGITASNPGLVEKMVSFLAASGQTTARQEMTLGALSLIGDYLFTGAGLETFPGLYSTYYLITPNYIIPHSYNLYLDVVLEQGVVALLAFLWVLGVSTIVLLIYRKSQSPHLLVLRWAVLASILIVVLHGFFDDVFYDYREAPLLLLFPGMAMALAAPGFARAPQDRGLRVDRRVYIGAALVVLALLVIGYIGRRPLIASWYANLGALRMARVELSEWNTATWNDGSQVKELKPAEDMFARALEYDPGNWTANHRLGLISMLLRDYHTAVAYLSVAYEKNQNHRGIVKALGLSYVWNGKPDQALPLLEKIPEAEKEMGIYPWWWRTQGREDLALYAEAFYPLLAPASTP